MALLRRLIGQETEFIYRWSPLVAGHRPETAELAQATMEGLASVTTLHRGPRSFGENGGAFYAEPGGFIESASPECRSPRQLLVHQRAQERLLTRSMRPAEEALPWRGRFGVVKNSRDKNGFVYGSQENYEVDIAPGQWALPWRWAALVVAVVWSFWSVVDELRERSSPLTLDPMNASPAALLNVRRRTWLFLRVLDRFGYRQLRHDLDAYFVSRVVFAGAGHVDDDDHFWLSEKAPSLERTMTAQGKSDRPIYGSADLLYPLLGDGNVRDLLRALRRPRRRLEVVYSDSNMADVAEYLKIGVTALLVDLSEAGLLGDAPQLTDVVDAGRVIARDADLVAVVDVVGGPAQTALQLQRRYLALAERAVATLEGVPEEASLILWWWRRVLDDLGRDPTSLFGKIDWVTKRALLEGVVDENARRKIDIKYHELDVGYFAALVRTGHAERLFEDDEIDQATTTPPPDSPAGRRGDVVRAGNAVFIGWDFADVRENGVLERVVFRGE